MYFYKRKNWTSWWQKPLWNTTKALMRCRGTALVAQQRCCFLQRTGKSKDWTGNQFPDLNSSVNPAGAGIVLTFGSCQQMKIKRFSRVLLPTLMVSEMHTPGSATASQKREVEGQVQACVALNIAILQHHPCKSIFYQDDIGIKNATVGGELLIYLLS